jgi:hypothetical protein
VGNLDIYNKLCAPPKEALKTISGGRMSGKTDINPMWRLKALTEQFGACGIGWYYEITKQWLEPGGKGEISAFCNINLFIKSSEEWSKPIPGVGGSSFVALEKAGLFTSDECYKMALTDALSVACKALGVAANVYWDRDPSKYDKPQQGNSQQQAKVPFGEPSLPPIAPISAAKAKRVHELATEVGVNEKILLANVKANAKVETVEAMTEIPYEKIMTWLTSKKKS